MVQSCVVVGCTNRWQKGSTISWHRIPAEHNPVWRKKWLSAINRKNWKPTSQDRVCGKHFVSGSASHTEDDPDYAPSLYLGYKSYHTSTPKMKVDRFARSQARKSLRLQDDIDENNRQSAASILIDLSSSMNCSNLDADNELTPPRGMLDLESDDSPKEGMQQLQNEKQALMEELARLQEEKCHLQAQVKEKTFGAEYLSQGDSDVVLIKMAPELTESRNFKLLLTSLALFTALIYISFKCYNILVYENSKQEEQWWLFRIFQTEDVSGNAEISILGTQLYTLLFHAVLEDFILIRNFVGHHFRLAFCSIFETFVQATQTGFWNYFTLVIVLFVFRIQATDFDRLVKLSKSIFKGNFSNYNKQITTAKYTDERTHSNSNIGRGVNCSEGIRKYGKWLTGLVVVAFLLTIPWEFMRLYQTAVAKKVAHMGAGTPAVCIPDQMSLTQTVKSLLRWQFSWTPDPCEQYHKALLQDPFYEVNPLKVISSAFSQFSHFFVYIIEHCLEGFAIALRLFFAEIPAQWQPVMLCILVIFFLLILVMRFEYCIQIPWILKFGPHTPEYKKNGGEEANKSESKREDSKAIQPFQ